MRHSLSILIALFLMVAPFAQVHAETPVPPTKESFLAAWEENVRSNPETKLFEKMDEAGVYNFETTLFPYKGRLKILNLLVEDRDFSSQGYEFNDYDSEDDSGHIGIVETELTDAPENWSEKYPYSFQSWRSANVLFFSHAAGVWMDQGKWKQHLAMKKAAEPPQSGICAQTDFWRSQMNMVISMLLPIVIILALLIPLCALLGRKQRQTYKTSFDRQLEALNTARESLSIQKEHLDLLKTMLETMRK